jgi:uncharacterized protein (DUF427 family)
MPKAIWIGAVLAQSDETIVVEGNRYFRATAIACSVEEYREL